MIAAHKGVALATVGAMLLSGCAATESAKERSVFLRQSVSAGAYGSDLVVCDEYVETNGASDSEQGGAAVMGLLFGGIVGLAAVGNSYDKSQNRLYEECMFSRGYRLVPVPRGLVKEPTGEDAGFDARKIAFALIEEGRAEELMVWQSATNSGDTERVRGYLLKFPDGHFAPDARQRLGQAGTAPAPRSK